MSVRLVDAGRGHEKHIMNREQAIELIRSSASELSRYSGRLIDELRPSIRIQAERVESDGLPLGASRIGGMPDLPPDFQWPTWMATQPEGVGSDGPVHSKPVKRELDFIAQIRLEDVKDLDPTGLLPSRGSLYFFFDIEYQPWGYSPRDRGGWHVVYTDTPVKELVRPEGLGEPDRSPSQLCRASFRAEFTLPEGEPDFLEPVMEAGEMGSFPGRGFPGRIFAFVRDLWTAPSRHCAAIHRLYEAYDALLGSLYERPDEHSPIHRMFGHAQEVQLTAMELECQLASNGIDCGDENVYESNRAKELEAGAKDWLLLLQIDTDEDNPGWMWGDAGRIYYWIREQDLRERNFAQTWLILQCG